MPVTIDQNNLQSSQQFVEAGRDLVTRYAQLWADHKQYAAIFEARSGATRFTDQKHVGENLTEQQLADNAALDEMADIALKVVTLHNDLNAFWTAPRLAILDQLRTDYR